MSDQLQVKFKDQKWSVLINDVWINIDPKYWDKVKYSVWHYYIVFYHGGHFDLWQPRDEAQYPMPKGTIFDIKDEWVWYNKEDNLGASHKVAHLKNNRKEKHIDWSNVNIPSLKNLVWKLDREVWAKVEAHEATTSWGREQSGILIIEFLKEFETIALEQYSKFLEDNGFMDSDWREEHPTAIKRFQFNNK